MAASKQVSYEVEDSATGGSAVFSYYTQTFTTSSAFTTSSVYLKFSVLGSPPDPNVDIALYAVDVAHKPTGAALDSTSLSISQGWNEFTLSAPLSASTEYAIVFSFLGIDFPGLTWQFHFNYDSAAGYSGYCWKSEDGNTWVAFNVDAVFQVWGELTLPTKATNPTPSDTATGVKKSLSQVSWDDGGNTDTFDVYFGPTGNVTLRSSAQAGTTWTITDTLSYEQEYTWRIDSTNVDGTTTGDTWTFTIEAFAPPVPTAQNAMKTNKILVAAANDKVYYET